MTPQLGPIYDSVPLIDSLPMPGGHMTQAMPSRADLEHAAKDRRNMRVVAGYEVLLATYINLREAAEGLAKAAKWALAAPYAKAVPENVGHH
jgi:hypothetical protein